MDTYNFTIDGKPDFALLNVTIPEGASLKVESSAMAAMDSNISMKTRLKGGLGRFLSGESLFINEFKAEGAPGQISIAPGAPGDLVHVHLNNETIYLQNSAFVAASPEIHLETKWQGLTKGFFSGESFFLIKCSGTGDLWFNTYGAMIEMVSVDDSLVVDTGHIVAFTDGLTYSVGKVGGYKSLFFSGEGLVCKFAGQGKIWLQTRKVPALTSWLYWFRPKQKSN